MISLLKLTQANYDQVIVAGGDGTVHFVANGLV
ncbi:MAG: hypothetical protein HC877_22715, partial [Thioploca sp.]|nr:hypothetical protein [Thioploca sp.]